MYNTTTTTPEINLFSGYGPNNQSLSIQAQAVPRRRTTPEDVRKYLVDMGWAAYSAPDGDWMYSRADIGFQNFMTWEQAVTYCLVKPFLEAYK
jgi:hypothetical protein